MESVKELEDKLYQKLNENPYDYNVLNKLGYIYLHSDNRAKSEEFYIKSIEIEKEQFEPYVSLSLICTIDGRLEKSLYYLLIAREKNNESLQSNKSTDEINALDKSIEEIRAAIINKEGKLNAQEVNEILEEADELSEANIEEALELYLKLNNLFPDDENISFKTALSFLRNDDYFLAKDLLNSIIKKHPNNAMAYHYLGIADNILNDFDSAKRNIIKSLELKPFLADMVTGRQAIYRKEYNEENIEKCPISGSDKFKPVNILNQSSSSLNFNIINPLRIWVESEKSGLIMSNPRPDKDSLTKYSFELYRYSKKIIDADIDKFIIESNCYNDRLNIIEKHVDKANCLDINSDNGIFISNAKNRGWNTIGVEENYLKCKKLKDKFDINIENTSFNNFNSDILYNLITLWESIEKIPDFIGTFQKIYSLLDKKGLFAFSFHDYESALVKNFGKNYPVWFYPDYLYFFKGSLLKKVLTDIGFKIVDVQVIARKYMSNVEFYCQK